MRTLTCNIGLAKWQSPQVCPTALCLCWGPAILLLVCCVKNTRADEAFWCLHNVTISYRRQFPSVCVGEHVWWVRNIATMSTCVAVTGAMVLLVAIYVGHFADMDDFGYHGVPLTSCTHDASVPGSEHPSSFFEGWYTKLVSADGSQSLAFVAGAHVRDDHDGGCAAESFLLIVTDNGVATPQRYYTSLPPTLDVTNGVVSLNETSVRVSRNSVFFDVRQSQDMPRVTGHVAAAKAGHFWPVTPLNPGAMGWFGWIPGMQCYHGIFSMSTYIDGSITIDGTEFNFDGGRLYQEKGM